MAPPTSKLAIAFELLDRALRLYYEEGSDFAVIHLAGAAEELLARHVERLGQESADKSLQRGAVRLSKYFSEDGSESPPKAIARVMNHAKNATKHMDANDEDNVHFDARADAHDLLDRAVSNYYQAMTKYELAETPLIRRFNQALMKGGA